MFPRTARERWWLAEPELKNRSQAIGLRLAIAYHEKGADGVGQLLPGDEAEEGVAPRTRALLAAMSHAMYNATLGEVYGRKEQDPYTGAHLFAAITAMCADEHEGGIQRMRDKADELDSGQSPRR